MLSQVPFVGLTTALKEASQLPALEGENGEKSVSTFHEAASSKVSCGRLDFIVFTLPVSS
jgi:hypothetical protein